MKKGHKIAIGGFTLLIVIYMIANSILVYSLFIKSNFITNEISDLEVQIKGDKIELQSQINELSTNLLATKETIGSLNDQINILKASASEDFSGIIGTAVNSIVTVKTDVAQGTGFIISENGFFVTNAHVLVDGHYAKAITSDQKVMDATLVGYDSDFDLALLKIDKKTHPLKLGNSDKIQVGEKVIAIGNPLGLQFSASEGIVSGVHRLGPNGFNSYIQTDAALNPGNSGGPLIDKQGEVIGINNFKIGGAEGLGFALESNYIKQVVNNIAAEKLNQTIIS